MQRQNKLDTIPLVLRTRYFWLLLLTFVAYGRVWQIQDVIWDDNAWLRSIYSTETLADFLKIGFESLKREPLGVFFYWFFRLHRDTSLFFIIWHGLDILVLSLTAMTIYVLIDRLFKHKSLAFFSAIAFIVFPLDYTIGYVSAINYRISLLLMVVSLLFSVGTVHKTNRRFLFLGSLITAGIAQYVFLEASFCFEPLRFWLFAFLFGGAQWYRQEHLQAALRKIIPFLLLSLPLIIYKLTVHTSGVHVGLYKPDITNLFALKLYAVSLAHFIFFPWVVLGLNATIIRWGTLFAAFLAIVVCVMMFQISNRQSVMGTSGINKALPLKQDKRMIFLFALTSMIPVFLLFQLIGRPISWGLDSTHAVLCQLGYALLIGYFLNWLWSGPLSGFSMRKFAYAPAIIMGLILAVGVFFSNLNIDQYYASWQSQSKFLSELLGRFPRLKQNTYFIADINSKDLYSDLRYYDIELPINLLYAQSTAKKEFYQYRIITAKDFEPFAQAPAEAQRLGKIKINLASDHGLQPVDISQFIFIYYRDANLLVNEEISAKFPDISYKSWLNRTVPKQDQHVPVFPLRAKLNFP